MYAIVISLVLSLSTLPLHRPYVDGRRSRSLQDAAEPERPLGSIGGTIKTSGGTPLAGATVRVEFRGRVWDVKSDTNGEYIITNVAPGNQQVEATLQGYSSKRRRIMVRAFQLTTLDFVLVKKGRR